MNRSMSKGVSKVAVKMVKKRIPLWKKVLDGANSGTFKARKAGDTRGEYAAVLNTISGFIIFGVMFFFAYLKHSDTQRKQKLEMRKEVMKMEEYKENMFFEAVQDILTKINDPKTKGSSKASLQKQLNDLDPKGDIQKFLNGKSRPDISENMNRPVKKGSNGSNGNKKNNNSISGSGGSKNRKDSRNVEENYNDDDEEEEKEEKIESKKNDRNSASNNGSKNNSKNSNNNNNDNNNVKNNKSDTKNNNENDDNKDEIYLEVLSELYEGLEGVISNKSRKLLVEYLKENIESIQEPSKKLNTIKKIASKLDDQEYWVKYAQKFE